MKAKCNDSCMCAAWTLSGLTVLLMPKCPACFAAYAVVLGGFAISGELALNIRAALLIFSATVFCVLTARYVVKRLR